MTSVIVTTRSQLQALILLADGQFVAFIYKGGVLLEAPYEGQRLRVIDLTVDGRGEEIKVSR
jgi:hypothetical protein